MKRFLYLSILMAVPCVLMTACTTWSSQGVVPFRCIVQSETGSILVYEIYLDDKLVTSGRTMPKDKGADVLEFTTKPGEHVLAVTAPGCEKWEKTIDVLNVVNFGQTFLVELHKMEK